MQTDCVPPQGDQAPSLSIAEYAELTGLSEKTVRRKVRQGTIAAVRIAGPYGPEYRIVRSGDPPSPRQSRQTPSSGQADSLPLSGQSPLSEQAPPLDSLITLVDRLTRENIEMAGRLGFYQSEIQHLQAQIEASQQQITLLSAPGSIGPESTAAPVSSHPTHSANGHAPGAERPPRRPWWKFWQV